MIFTKQIVSGFLFLTKDPYFHIRRKDAGLIQIKPFALCLSWPWLRIKEAPCFLPKTTLL